MDLGKTTSHQLPFNHTYGILLQPKNPLGFF
jgi:hypothetical protein